jgi:hypothetical protein
MFPWVFIIFLLDIALVFQIAYCADCESKIPMLIIGAGIALSSIAAFIRMFRKMKQGRLEQMSKDLDALRSENKELLARLADIREREIMQRTDDNLV